MHIRIRALTNTPMTIAGRILIRKFPKDILLRKAITKFWGLPIGVAEDPIFALEARARRKG